MKKIGINQKIESMNLTQKTKFLLLDLIKQELQENTLMKLPKEEELAQQLGISRNLLRDVLVILEEEGYISRRRSKGTIVNPHVAKEKGRIDLVTEFEMMIEQEGFTASSKVLEVRYIEEVDEVFQSNETGYLKNERIFYADNEPVIYCVDRIAGSVAKKGEAQFEKLEHMKFFDFIQECCGDTITGCLAEITPIMPTKQICEKLQIDAMTPLLCFEQRSFNPEHEIINHAHVYLKTGKLTYSILRKRFWHYN